VSDALNQDEIDRLLQTRLYAVMATSRPDGRPHAVPVAFLFHEGRIWLASSAGTVRARNLAARPDTALVVMGPHDDDDHVVLVIEGKVRREDDPATTRAVLADAWNGRFGDQLDWANVIYQLLPTKVLSHGHGGLDR
jgi:nitroimidazol reductase NimA-like FMN-containing flavoprotein (pyridoxamine 5'-phosphate oxidase superfamily)